MHISLIISNLVVLKPLSAIVKYMHNFIVKFAKILEIVKEFAGNRVTEHGNILMRGIVSKFSNLEVIALTITTELCGFDSENYLFKRFEYIRIFLNHLFLLTPDYPFL